MHKTDTIICRCEEVTLAQIEEAIRMGATSLKAIKKITRAGMGDCQGKTCHRQVMALLAKKLNIPIDQLEEDLPRFPLMPVPLEILKNGQEEAATAKGEGEKA